MIPETPERGHKYYTQADFFFPLDRLKSLFFLKGIAHQGSSIEQGSEEPLVPLSVAQDSWQPLA